MMTTPLHRLLPVTLAALLAGGCATSRPAPAPAQAEAAPAPVTVAPKVEASEPEAPPAPKPAAVGLRVDTGKKLAPVRRAVLSGFNFGNWMQVADFTEDLQAVKPAELRFPGGNIGDENDLTDYALATFQSNLSMLDNPPTVIQTRTFDRNSSIQNEPAKNQPEDAANAVRWARARNIKVSFWEIGNEPDLFAVTRSDPSWTAEKYCQVFRAQAAAIRAVDPSARVGGPAVSGAVPGRDRFLAEFVKGCGDVLDVLTWHIYPTDGQAEDDHAFATVGEADQTIAAFKALLKDPARNPKGWQRPVDLALTEYGLSWFSSRMHHLTDMPAAMWAMEMAFRFDEQGVASAHYFAFQGTSGHGLLDQAGIRRPTYYVFTTLNRLSGDLVPAATGDDDLWSHAALDGDRLDVVVTNKATTAKGLPVEVPGFTLRHAAYFDFGVADAEKPMARLAPGASVSLPPRSVVHLVYGKGDAAVADPYPAKAAEAKPAQEEPAKPVKKAKATKRVKKPAAPKTP
jgi:hypothetical protein